MSEKEDEKGILSQIRRISRRLSGSFLDAKPGPLVVQREFKPIHSYDDSGHLTISKKIISLEIDFNFLILFFQMELKWLKLLKHMVTNEMKCLFLLLNCFIINSHTGTPVYIYDVNRLIDNYNVYLGSLRNVKSFLLCYPVKVSNAKLIILNPIFDLVNFI